MTYVIKKNSEYLFITSLIPKEQKSFLRRHYMNIIKHCVILQYSINPNLIVTIFVNR